MTEHASYPRSPEQQRNLMFPLIKREEEDHHHHHHLDIPAGGVAVTLPAGSLSSGYLTVAFGRLWGDLLTVGTASQSREQPAHLALFARLRS